MSYQFKLSRRVARLRAPALAALAVAMSACNAGDTTGSNISPTDANPTPLAVRATAGGTISAMTSATGSCLTQSGPLVTLTGDQSVYNDRKSTQSNRRVDARSAWWSGLGDFPGARRQLRLAGPLLDWRAHPRDLVYEHAVE